jgi:hypothetical protein
MRAWEYLLPTDRKHLMTALPVMQPYARLRQFAALNRHHLFLNLRQPRPPPDKITGLCPRRTRDIGAALLSFACDYGDTVRWLGGEYTNRNRDWATTSDLFQALSNVPQRPGYPPLDYKRALQCNTQGVPLHGFFECKLEDQRRRAAYDNHGPVTDAADDVFKKFADEEANSFHLALPRFLTFFIIGIFINPISWVMQKGKGRICIDSSTKLGEDDTGAPNDYIPKAGAPGKENFNPPVFMDLHFDVIWLMCGIFA